MNRITMLLLAFLVFSCDYGTKWEDTPYQVIWIDTKENRTLVYELDNDTSVERVKAEVIAVGSNEKYIVVKQRDIDNKSISYFYIERSKDGKYQNADEISQGPLSSDKFAELKKQLGLPDFSDFF